jgi:hypothetical protein
MFTVGPTFFSRPLGDHPEGDGLTRLQTTFAGASADDISGFAVPASVNGGTLGDGYYDVAIGVGESTTKGVTYSSTGIARQASGQALTVEVFLSLQYYPEGDNGDGQTHVNLNNLTSNMTGGNYPIRIATKGGVGNTNYAQYGQGYANWDQTGDPAPGLLTSIRHLAWVWYSDNTYAMYYNGVRQAAPAADSSYLLGAPTPFVLLGSPSNSYYWTNFVMRYYGVRVRRASMYSGATITPPASPADWGPP